MTLLKIYELFLYWCKIRSSEKSFGFCVPVSQNSHNKQKERCLLKFISETVLNEAFSSERASIDHV